MFCRLLKNFLLMADTTLKKFLHNKWSRRLIRFSAAIMLLGIMFFATCFGLGKIILHAKHCEAFMIDNTEVYTHINIPEIESIDCNFKSRERLKRVYFVIKKSVEAMPEYIRFSAFQSLNNLEGLKPLDFFRYNTDTLALQANKKSLFYKEHTYSDGAAYKALLDPSTGQVWINIIFEE